MSVFRINKSSNYTVISNYHLREKNMSLKAKGLLTLMLSLPDNWDYSLIGLVAICKENKHAIQTTLKELKEFGYLKIDMKKPNETKTGRIEYLYNVYEFPLDENERQKVKKQYTNFQYTENQYTENQFTENQTQ